MVDELRHRPLQDIRRGTSASNEKILNEKSIDQYIYIYISIEADPLIFLYMNINIKYIIITNETSKIIYM